VLTLAGVSSCSVALLYLVCDRAAWWTGRPFTWLGKNSIVVYAGSEILQLYFPFTFVVNNAQLQFASHALALASNGIGVACWMFVAWSLAENGVFVKL
jgi:hypothetical protein